MKSTLVIGFLALLCACGVEPTDTNNNSATPSYNYDQAVEAACESAHPTSPVGRTCKNLHGSVRAGNMDIASYQSERVLELMNDPENMAEVVPSTWSTIRLVDEFGDTVGRAAVSEWTSPRQGMSFPYGDVEGRIIVNCDDVWFRFNEQPNLTNTEPQSGGYSTLSVRYRADGDRDGTWSAIQQWGGNDISVSSRDDSGAVSVISGASEVSIVLPWYGSGNVVFQWNLAGSTNAIKSSCN